MKRTSMMIAVSGLTALSACGSLGGRDALVTTDNTDTGFGAITPAILSENRNWSVTGEISGAQPGEIVARNAAMGQCAYARGDSTFYTAPCP